MLFHGIDRTYLLLTIVLRLRDRGFEFELNWILEI